MVNFGFGAASILGIFLAVAGAALYFLRSVRPELSRDHDIFFAAVGLLCGFILLFQGWRLDPILQFGQLLLTGSTIFFAVESVRLRGVATEQAKRNTPIVDDERPVSPFYRQEAQLYDYDELPEEDDDRPIRPRIRPSRDSRTARADEYGGDRRSSSTDDYEEGTRRRSPRTSSSSQSSSQRLGQGDNRRRSNRPTSRPIEQPEDEWSSPKRPSEDWDDSGSRVGRSPRDSSRNSTRDSTRDNNGPRPDRNPNASSRPRKRRPPQEPSLQSDVEATPTDYVDYRPIDLPEEDPDNLANFDEV